MVRLLLAVILGIAGWLPSGGQVVALPTIGVTIDGGTVTSQLLSASWNLGISDFLADLSPNTASLQFKGQLSVSPADAVVITAGGTAMWTGRLDTYTETRDVNGDYWSSVTATDLIGALGAAHLEDVAGTSGTGDSIIESMASTAGITIDVVDSSSEGLASLDTYAAHHTDNFTGSVLEYARLVANSSNAMLALQRDGKIKAWTREKMAEGFVTNGTFDVNTTGWTNVNGGAISRVTASPYAGAGNARIVSSSTAFSGSRFAITGTFKKDHTYRLDLRARTISGSAVVLFILGETSTDDASSTPTLTSSWDPYSVDWTPTADRTAVYVDARNNAAASNTFEIDSVAVTEVVNATDISASIVTWEKTTSIDVDINRWVLQGGSGALLADSSDAADVAIYGERAYIVDAALDVVVFQYDDWAAYGGSQRPIVTNGELVVSSSTSPLLALDPLDWVYDGTDNWQIMSMTWSAAPGEPWRLTITADNLIYLLRGF